MVDPGRSEPRYHVLLIGVDHYKDRALRGCVNDIDAVQRILLGERMNVPAASIRRLVSPLPGTDHDTTVPERPASLDNVRGALMDLANPETVLAGDRVFIYYSGHGSRVDVPVAVPDAARSPRFYRESLV